MHIFTLTVAAVLLGQTPADPTPGVNPGKPPALSGPSASAISFPGASITGGSVTVPEFKDGKLSGGSITAPAIHAAGSGGPQVNEPSRLSPAQADPTKMMPRWDTQVQPAQAVQRGPAEANSGPSFTPSAFTPSSAPPAHGGGAAGSVGAGGAFNAPPAGSARRGGRRKPSTQFQAGGGASARIGAPVVQPSAGAPSQDAPVRTSLGDSPKMSVPTGQPPLMHAPVHATEASAPVVEPERMPAYSRSPRTAAPLRPVATSLAPARATVGSALAPASAGEVRIGGPSTQVISGDSPAAVTVRDETATAQMLRDAVVNSKVLANGEPVSLLDAISRGNGRQQQQKTVKAYWTLSLALADYYFAATESDSLAKLRAPGGTNPSRLQAAQSAAYARAVEARLAMTAAQHDFAEAASLPADDPQYLTVDLPFTGGYRTNFAALFANREAPVVMRRLNRMLPVFGELIEARTQAAESAEQSFMQQQRDFAAGRGAVESLLASHTHLRKQRMQLLKDIGNYNNSIAVYALAVGGNGLPHEKVTAMLIEHPRRVLRIPASVNSSQVLPVSGQQPVRVGTRQYLQPTGVPTLAPLPR